MSRHVRQIILTLSLPAIAGVIGGCRNQPQAAPPVQFNEAVLPRRQEDWSARAVAVPPQQTFPIKSGALPLVYMMEGEGVIRIVDLTSNATIVDSLNVPRNTIVSLTAGGISIGGARLRATPLAAEHQYGIFIQDRTDNSVRVGTIREGRPGLPQATPVAPPQAAPPASQPGGAQ